MGVSGVQRLVQFRGDRGRLNGRTNRTTDSGILRLDDIDMKIEKILLKNA